MTFSRPQLFSEAIQRLRQRMPVASRMNTAEWIRSMPLAVRERSLWSATIEDAHFMQRLQQALDDYLTDARELINTPDGRQVMMRKVGNRADFIQIMRRFAESEGLGPLDPRDKNTIKDITSSARLGMIFDVQIASAREFGRWKQGQDPDVLQEFPAYRFIRATEVTTPRKLHQEFEFAVRLKSDLPFWLRMNDPLIGGFGVPWGPWGFNSGMDVEEVDREEAESLGLLGPTDIVEPIEGAWNDHVEASATGLDQPQLDWIKSQLGPLVDIRGDRIVFVDQSKPQPTPPKAREPKPPAKRTTIPSTPTEKMPVPVPAPAPKIAPALPTARAPVGDAMILHPPTTPNEARHVDAMRTVLKSIAEVHDDGILPKVPLAVGPTEPGVSGWFQIRRIPFTEDGIPTEIRIRPSEDRPHLILLHEIGHWIDWGALGTRQFSPEGFGSVSSPEMRSVMRAIEASKRIAWIRKSRFSAATRIYLLSAEEMWARAYAQFVASRLPGSQLAIDLAADILDPLSTQWPAEEFAPIAAEIETLFRARGWIQTEP